MLELSKSKNVTEDKVLSKVVVPYGSECKSTNNNNKRRHAVLEVKCCVGATSHDHIRSEEIRSWINCDRGIFNGVNI